MARAKRRRTTTDGALGHLNNLSQHANQRGSPPRRHTDIYDIPSTPELKRRPPRNKLQFRKLEASNRESSPRNQSSSPPLRSGNDSDSDHETPQFGHTDRHQDGTIGKAGGRRHERQEEGKEQEENNEQEKFTREDSDAEGEQRSEEDSSQSELDLFSDFGDAEAKPPRNDSVNTKENSDDEDDKKSEEDSSQSELDLFSDTGDAEDKPPVNDLVELEEQQDSDQAESAASNVPYSPPSDASPTQLKDEPISAPAVLELFDEPTPSPPARGHQQNARSPVVAPTVQVVIVSKDPPAETRKNHASLTPQVNAAEEAEAEANHKLHEWFWAETQNSRWEKYWRTLLSKKLELNSHAPSALPGYLKSAHDMLSELQILCQRIPDVPETLDLQIQNLAASAFLETRQVLHDAAYSNRDAQSKRNRVKRVEVHLLTEMVTLIMLCFGTYRQYGDAAYTSLNQALTLLLNCVDQIDALHRQRYVSMGKEGHKSSTLRLPLTRLLAAMEAGELDDRLEPQPETEAQSDDILPTQGEWTRIEEQNLMDALQHFTEGNRFVLIQRHYGQHFRGRTVRDLQAKAKEIQAAWMSTAPDARDLASMSWLTSV